MPVKEKISSAPIEVRPTLIIGLGGTGTVAVQWARKYICELFEDEVPPFVRFLAIDTDVQELSDAPPLPIADFKNLYERIDLRYVLQGYKQNPADYPYLTWLSDMPLDSALIAAGCQGLSRLGRTVYFQTRETVIQPEVAQRLSQLSDTTLSLKLNQFDPWDQFVLAPNARPIIHICSSICGGTGSGMLLDLAYDVRDWCVKTCGQTPDVVAHLLLPEAFPVAEGLVRNKLQAVAKALLEQIEFLSEPEREAITITYRDTSQRRISPVEAPFDLCFLISGNSPSGVDSRETLTEMIGRMLRALTVEPVGRVILSDANNKQNDILSRRDDLTKRRLFLASYGVRSGTVQEVSDRSIRATVETWLMRALRDLERARLDQIPQELQDRVRNLLDGTALRRQAGKHIEPLDPAHRRFTTQAVAASELTKQAERFIQTVADEWLEGQYRKVDGYLHEVDQLVDELKAIFEQALLVGGPSAGAGVLQLALETVAEKAQPADDGADRERREAILEKTVRSSRPRVEELQQAAREALEQLAQRLAHQLAREFAARAQERLKQQIEALRRRLARAADFAYRNAVRQHAQDDGQPTRCALPVIELTYPLEGNMSAHHYGAEEIRRIINETRQHFLREVLAPCVQSVLSTDDDTITVVDDAVRTWVRNNEQTLQEFWRYYREQQVQMVYKEVSRNKADSHPMLQKLRELDELARPRIIANTVGKHDEPLESVFVQHVERSCVPQLVRDLLGQGTRSVEVTGFYGRQTHVLVDLVHVTYGLSVLALAPYDTYGQAAAQYLRGTSMGPRHLWLDDAWYDAYRKLMEALSREHPNRSPASVTVDQDGRAGVHETLAHVYAQMAKLLADLPPDDPLRREAEAVANAVIHLLAAANTGIAAPKAQHALSQAISQSRLLLEKALQETSGREWADWFAHEVVAKLESLSTTDVSV